jgi:hypothetical protein
LVTALRTVSTGPVSRELRPDLRVLLPRERFEGLVREFPPERVEDLLRDDPCGRCRDERRVVDALERRVVDAPLRLLLVCVAIRFLLIRIRFLTNGYPRP